MPAISEGSGSVSARSHTPERSGLPSAVRGAEDGPFDGWLDVRGSPYSEQAKFTERYRRPIFGKLEIDVTVEDAKAYTKPFTVRVNQRIMVDQEMIEFICNENEKSTDHIPK